MGTRSTIALEFADGSVQMVYCHWDGYLEYNGAILEKHWKDPFKLQKLIDLGDMSSLGTDVGVQHGFDERNGYDSDNFALQCTFYGRDLGEKNIFARKFKDFEDYARNHQREEYEYILRNVNGKATWFVDTYGHDGEYMTMADAVAFQKAKYEDEEFA